MLSVKQESCEYQFPQLYTKLEQNCEQHQNVQVTAMGKTWKIHQTQKGVMQTCITLPSLRWESNELSHSK